MTTKRTYWNAEVYDKIGTPMRGWAQAVIDDIGLKGDETVLDAGCGSGSVTLDLWERCKNGVIYALDSSPDMIAKLQATLAERGITNIIPMQADLTDFTLPEQVDVVFSNAVFHWIQDDAGLFGSLARATKPGGRLRAQCGGGTNIKKLMTVTHEIEAREPYSQYLHNKPEPRKYRTEEQAVAALEANGWTNARARVFPSDVPFEDVDHAVLYLKTIILQQQASALPEELSERFLRDVIAEVIKRHGEPFVADYVRLDLWAERA
ncbi:MAG TPA: methyltransferase domain-containing protein [Dehalococcoidia bacterium]|jgi:trans-aconitate 2-methyltransferase|nr:methyltransferase domain-containing protein [Dehalococcoidia bacterium]